MKGNTRGPEAYGRLCQNPLAKWNTQKPNALLRILCQNSDINQTPQRFAQVHCKEWLALKWIPLPDYDQHLNECHSQNRTHLSGSSAKFQYSIKQHSASRKCAARKWIARNTDREGPDRSQRRKGQQQGENYDYICIRQLVGQGWYFCRIWPRGLPLTKYIRIVEVPAVRL